MTQTLGAIEAAGLAPGADVRVTNLGLQEIVSLVGAGADEATHRWGATDAAAAWDPAFANLEHSGAVRVIDTQTITSVVMMDDVFNRGNPGVSRRFMEAMHAAYDHVRLDPEGAATRFKEHAGLPFDTDVLALAASPCFVDRNGTETDHGTRIHSRHLAEEPVVLAGGDHPRQRSENHLARRVRRAPDARRQAVARRF